MLEFWLAIALTVTPAAVVPTPPPAIRPANYTLADRTGKVWYGPDPAWLAEWVRRMNTAPLVRVAPTCANGRCPR
jgi:hypothetical protein